MRREIQKLGVTRHSKEKEIHIVSEGKFELRD